MSTIRTPQYRIGFFDGYNANEPACATTDAMTVQEYLEYRQGLDDGLEAYNERAELDEIVESLESDVSSLNESLDEALGRTEGLKCDISGLEDEIESLEETIAELRTELAEAEGEVAGLRDNIRGYSEEIASLGAEVDERDETIEQLARHLDDLQMAAATAQAA